MPCLRQHNGGRRKLRLISDCAMVVRRVGWFRRGGSRGWLHLHIAARLGILFEIAGKWETAKHLHTRARLPRSCLAQCFIATSLAVAQNHNIFIIQSQIDWPTTVCRSNSEPPLLVKYT